MPLKLTLKHKQSIAYAGIGLYHWNPLDQQWQRLNDYDTRRYQNTLDVRSFGLVKLFDHNNTVPTN